MRVRRIPLLPFRDVNFLRPFGGPLGGFDVMMTWMFIAAAMENIRSLTKTLRCMFILKIFITGASSF